MAATVKPAENLPAMQAGGKVAAIIPTNFNEVVQIAGAIVRAGMAPRSYEGSTEKATVAIMAGMEVGLTPFAALQSIAVINGTPAVFGDGLVALVRGSGLLEDMEEGLDVDKEGQPQLAWCKVKRKGEKTWKHRELTWPECVRAGWTRKVGPWTQTPGRMMTIRVRGWLYRDVFADVLKGLKSAEEALDMVDITPKAEAPPEPQRSDYIEQPSPPPADSPGGGNGQPASGDAAGADGDRSPEAASKRAPITDVEDLTEVTTFEHYRKIGDFFTFSDTFLQDPKRTVAEAEAWHEFYREYLKEKGQHKNEDIRAAVLDTLVLYDAILKRGREPGEEG